MDDIPIKTVLEGKKLVFVLGAGASNDFGYPIGAELRDKILDSNCSFVENKFGITAVKEFQACFRQSGLNSIDAFLEKSELFKGLGRNSVSYMDIGKYYIARILLEKENENRLLQTNNNWYRYIYNLIHDDLWALTDGRIRFITFNYDLSLEHFLYNVLVSHFGYSATNKEKQEVVYNISKMDIIHVYGRLGYLNWEKSEDPHWKHRIYGRFNQIQDETTRTHFIQQCADGIHLIRYDEDVNSQNTFGQAIAQLCTADYLCFLGFGFDKINVARLNLENLYMQGHKPAKILLMGYGFGDAERNICTNHFSPPVRKRIHWSHPAHNIIDFFKDKLDIWF